MAGLGLFKRGEKVRLRFINGSAMTFFDVRIPGLKMTVVAADGQNVEPVTVDEFRIGVAETYDVIVEPKDDRAYTLFAQAIDRSGYARGTLTPDPSLSAEVPDMDPARSWPMATWAWRWITACTTWRHGSQPARHGRHGPQPARHVGRRWIQHGRYGSRPTQHGRHGPQPAQHGIDGAGQATCDGGGTRGLRLGTSRLI